MTQSHPNLSPSEALTGRELNRRDGIILLLTHNMQSWADTFVVSLDAFVKVTFGAGCDQPRANMARVY